MNLSHRLPSTRGVRAALAVTALAATHCSAPAASDDSGTEATPEALLEEPSLAFGTWRSPACEPVDETTFQLRTYRIASNGVFADWERFASPDCAAGTKLYTLRMGGGSRLDRLSDVVKGALEIRVFIDEKAILPTSAAGLARVQAECPTVALRVGTESDVTATGCGRIVPPRAACPVEYDLMKLGWKTLTFGDRAHTLCTNDTRPRSLSRWSVTFLHLGG